MKSILTLCAFFVVFASHAQDSLRFKQGDTVKIQAQFPGGPQGWMAYLQKNLRAEVGGDNIVLRRHQKGSIETVIVSFLVDTAGSISEVKVENPATVNPAVGAEAVRVIQKGPKWMPATINGVKVIYRQKQSISFEVSQG